jgi:hypothetical protein
LNDSKVGYSPPSNFIELNLNEDELEEEFEGD